MRYSGLALILGVFVGTAIGVHVAAHSPVQLNTVSTTLQSDNQFRYWMANSTMITDVSIHATGDGVNFKLPHARDNFANAEISLRQSWTLLNEVSAANKDYGVSNKICCTGTHNHTVLNYTFPKDVPIAHLDYRFFSATNLGTGNIIFTTTYHSDTGAQLAFNVTTHPCAGGSFLKNYPRDRLSVRRIQVFADDAACSLPGDWSLYANGISAWSANNKDDTINGVSNALEYADWLVNRTSFKNSRLPDDFGLTTFEEIIIPQGKSVLFLPGPTEGCGIHPWFPNAWIQGNTNVRFLGFSVNRMNVMIGAFEFDNQQSPFTQNIRGSGGSVGSSPCGGVPWFLAPADVNRIYTNTEIINGGNWSSVGAHPIGVACPSGNTICIDSGVSGPQYGGLLYHTSRAPLNAISQDAAFNIEPNGNFDVTNITLVSLGTRATRADNTRLVAPINNTVSYGNAFYMVIAARNVTSTPELCNDNVTLLSSGKSVPLAWTRSSRGPSPDGFFVRICAWLLRDVARQESLPVGFATSTLPAREYRGIITSDSWPQRAVDADNGQGYELFAITGFGGAGGQGRHSESLQCPPSELDAVGRPVCFGNINTGDQIGAEVGETKWRFHTADASESSNMPVANASGVRLQDSISGNSNTTDSGGRANVSTLSNIVRWTFTKSGYRTEYANFTNVPLTLPINFSVHITADFTKQPSLSCSFNVTASQYECELRQFNTTAEALDHRGQCLDVLDIRTNQCQFSPGGLKPRILTLDCSRDVTGDDYIIDTKPNTFTRWSVQDSTGVSLTVRVPPEKSGVTVCDREKAVESRGVALFDIIQSGTLTITLTTPEYRTIKFSLDGITQTSIVITPYLTECKRGVVSVCREFESTDKVEVTFSNTTRVSELSGESETFTIISARDVSFVGSRPGIASNIIGTGAILGAEADAASRAIFGILILMGLLILFGGGYYRVTKDKKSGKGDLPPPMMAASVSIVAFFIVGMLGLWPSWVIILVGMFVVGLGAIAAITFIAARRGAGAGGGKKE